MGLNTGYFDSGFSSFSPVLKVNGKSFNFQIILLTGTDLQVDRLSRHTVRCTGVESFVG